jgi:ribosomal protein S13
LAQKVPGVGKVRSRRAMAELGVDEDARWGEIDEDVLRALWAAMTDAATLPILNRTAQSRARSSSSSVKER